MIGFSAHSAGHENGAALTLAWRRVIGPGFALPRDAGQRPAFQAVRAIRTVGDPTPAAFSLQRPGGP